MSQEYNPKEIEERWQKEWEKSGIYNAEDKSPKPKYYSLIEFPYPSGDGLHVGHPRPYIGLDVVSRKRRMEGFNVLYPIGWDAFGLPTENFALKTGKDPRVVTQENSDIFRRQIQSLGISFDWSREINTTDPKYYKWTQWIFLKLLENGLAYKARMPINWCPKDKIGLANEEVVDGKCERCGTEVEMREKEQWMLAITKYADRLYDDLDGLDYPERVKSQQRNWIGRSEGALIRFDDYEVFTTRPDTIFGATYLAKAGKADKFTGKYVTNPATKEKIPVWEAEYVMSDYGTGAVMGVPAHDERDFEFAKKHSLPIRKVIRPVIFHMPKSVQQIAAGEKSVIELESECWPGEGELVNSDDFNGQRSEGARKKIVEWLGGKWVTKYKLRDWIFSRQRYWGEPIPVIHCEKCGVVPVPEKDLPVELPVVEKYQPRDDGESPLASMGEWVNVECPKCGGKARRETDVMPNWAGSSWYFLAYLFSKDGFNTPVSTENWKLQIENLRYYMPVDWYNGGMEHTTLHLLYSRFWHKFLYDLKLVPTSEPYKKRTSHGLILAEGGVKMSKSKGNVVSPDAIVEHFGADTLRLYEMFMGPFEQAIAWSDSALVGPRRFLERVWKLRGRTSEINRGPTSESQLHQTIKKVSYDIENLGFNTAVSTLMVYTNMLEKRVNVSQDEYEVLLKLLAPFAPHITEELWSILGHKNSIHTESWPKFDESQLVQKITKIAIQVSGKVRATIEISSDESEANARKIALSMPEIKKWVEGKEITDFIYKPGKIINIVVR